MFHTWLYKSQPYLELVNPSTMLIVFSSPTNGLATTWIKTNAWWNKTVLCRMSCAMAPSRLTEQSMGRRNTSAFVKRHSKKCCASHKASFTHPKYIKSTTLSTEYWKVKEENRNLKINWKYWRPPLHFPLNTIHASFFS